MALTQSADLLFKIKAKDESASKEFGKTKKDLDSTFGKGLTDLINPTTLAIGGMTAALTGAVTVIADSVKVASNFESSMAKVQAITGATGTDFTNLSKLARDMGANTAFSATQAAEGIQFLGMAGLSTDQIITGLEPTLRLAQAGAIDLGMAADISSNIMSAMGLEADDLSHIVDGLAQTARSSNTNVSMMGESFKFVAATASAAGLNFDETSASLGILGNAGLQASMGGTTLNAALTSILNPAKEAQETIDRLGLQFLQANGNLKPMVEIVGQLETSSISTTEMIEIFGNRGFRAINALVTAGSPKLQELTDAITTSGGVAEEMANIQMATFEGAIKNLKSASEEFQIQIGTFLLPTLTDIATAATGAVRGVNDLVKSISSVGNASKQLDVSKELAALAALGVDFNAEAITIQQQLVALETSRIKLGAQINSSRQTLRREGEGIVKDAEDASERLDVLNTSLAENYISLIALREEENKWVGIGTSSAGTQANALEKVIEKQVRTSELLKALTTDYGDQAIVQDKIKQLKIQDHIRETAQAFDDSAVSAEEWAETLANVEDIDITFAPVVSRSNRPDVPLDEFVDEDLDELIEDITVTPIELPFDPPEVNATALAIQNTLDSAFTMATGTLIRTGSLKEAAKGLFFNVLDSAINGVSESIGTSLSKMFTGAMTGEGGGLNPLAAIANPLKAFFSVGGGGGGAAGAAGAAGSAGSLGGIITAVAGPALVLGAAAIGTKVVKGIIKGVRGSQREFDGEIMSLLDINRLQNYGFSHTETAETLKYVNDPDRVGGKLRSIESQRRTGPISGAALEEFFVFFDKAKELGIDLKTIFGDLDKVNLRNLRGLFEVVGRVDDANLKIFTDVLGTYAPTTYGSKSGSGGSGSSSYSAGGDVGNNIGGDSGGGSGGASGGEIFIKRVDTERSPRKEDEQRRVSANNWYEAGHGLTLMQDPARLGEAVTWLIESIKGDLQNFIDSNPNTGISYKKFNSMSEWLNNGAWTSIVGRMPALNGDLSKASTETKRFISRQLGIGSFMMGGKVPGTLGDPVPVMAHAGETITASGQPEGGSSGGNNYVYVTNNFQALDRAGIESLSGEFEEKMVEILQRLSEGGQTILYNSGISIPPLS